MALTFEQLGQRVKQAHPEYGDLSDYEVGSRVVNKYPQYRDMIETPNVPQETQNPGIISRFFTGVKDTVPKLGNELLQRGRNIVSAFKSGAQYDPDKGIIGNTVEGGLTPLHVAGQVAGAVGDAIGAGAGLAYKTAVSEPTQQKIQGHVLDILNTPEGQTGLNALKQGMDYYQRFKEANPETAKSLEDVLNIATVVPGVKIAKEGFKEAKNVASDAIDLTARITNRGEEAIGKAIDSGIEKGVRPSVVGKKTAQQMESYKQSARTAVLAITKNKKNLSFLNDVGESIKGSVPSSLKEFTEAVEQTKKTIFKKYDSLAKKAGEAGGKVELSNVADELRKVGQDNVLRDLYPDVVSYAEKRAESLSKRASYSTEEAQTAIKHLNESLQAFYRNPTFESASKAQIDAMIANNIRTSLDNVITNATGEGYSALKKVYGSLKSIEKDVAHRSIVDARKNVKSLIDFTDIFSAGDIISGIATNNPAQIAKGGFQKAIATVYKKLNDPNRTIKKMFQEAERYIQKKETKFTPKSYTGKALQSMKGKGGMNIQDVSGGKAGYATKRGFSTGAGRSKGTTKALFEQDTDLMTTIENALPKMREKGADSARGFALQEDATQLEEIMKKLANRSKITPEERQFAMETLQRTGFGKKMYGTSTLGSPPKKGSSEIRSTIVSKKAPLSEVLNKSLLKEIDTYTKKNPILEGELVDTGTVSDWITDSKLKSILKDAGDIQVTIGKNIGGKNKNIKGLIGKLPDGKLQIQLEQGLSENEMKRILTEESLHALRIRKGKANFEAEKLLKYNERPTEKSAHKGVDNLFGKEMFGLPVKTKGTKTILSKKDSLLQEARKYTSAEEFVKAQGKPIYHSTDSTQFSNFDPTRAAKGEAYFNPLGDGMYLSNDSSFTKRFGANMHEYVLPKDIKTKVITDKRFVQNEYPTVMRATLKNLGIDYWKDTTLNEKVLLGRLAKNNPPIQAYNEAELLIREDIAPRLGIKLKPNQVKDTMQSITTKRNAGYDAVIYRSTDSLYSGTQEIIIPPEKFGLLKTKSQLTDIWKKAHKK